MYRSFQVHNFRCFHKLALADLERVNLIAGVNNIGKTSLLEALFLHCGAYNPELALRVNAFRGIETVKVEIGRLGETPWDILFHKFDITKTVELAGKHTVTGHASLGLSVLQKPSEIAKVAQYIGYVTDKSQKVLDTSKMAEVLQFKYKKKGHDASYYLILDQKGIRFEPIPPAPPFPAFFQAARMRIPFREEADRFRKFQVRGEQDVILEFLNLIEPRLRRLEMVFEAGEPMLHGDIGEGRTIPLPLMGEGMVRLTSLVTHIGNAPNGVVLVDEFENGLHYSVLPKVWDAVGKAARKFNTQVFATTHSLECIAAAHRAFSESKLYDFRLHRLEFAEGTIRAVTYDQETLEAAIEMGLEVR